MEEEQEESKTLETPYDSQGKCQKQDHLLSDMESDTQEIKKSWKLNPFFKGLLEHLRQSWIRSYSEEANGQGFQMVETPESKRKVELRGKEFESRLFKGLQIFRYQQGQHVYKLGDQKKGLYLVWRGEVECRIKTNVDIVRSGQYFGEKEAILNALRYGDAICLQDSVILSFNSEIFEGYIANYLKQLNPILKVMDQGMPRSVLSAFLTRSNIIHLATFSTQLKYVYGSYVYLQNDQADCFYFLSSGTISFLQTLPTKLAKSAKRTVQVSILDASDVFGEEALIYAQENQEKMATLGIFRTMTAQVISDAAIVYQITFEQYLRFVFMRYSQREFEHLLKDIISNKLTWYKNRVQSVLLFEQKAQMDQHMLNQESNENSKRDSPNKYLNSFNIEKKQPQQRSSSPTENHIIPLNQIPQNDSPKKLNTSKNLLRLLTSYDSPEKRKKLLHLTEKRFYFCSKDSGNLEPANSNSNQHFLDQESYSMNHSNQDSTVQHCIERLQQKYPTQYITRRAVSTEKQRICLTSPSRNRSSKTQQLSFNYLESSKKNTQTEHTNIELMNLLKTPSIHGKKEGFFENPNTCSRQSDKIIHRTKTEEDSLLIKKSIQNEQNSQLYCLEQMNRQQEKLIVTKVLFRKLQTRDFHFKDQIITPRRPSSSQNGDKSHRIAVDILANYFQSSKQNHFLGQKNTDKSVINDEFMHSNKNRSQQLHSSKNSLITFYRSPAKSQTALKSRPFRSASQKIPQKDQLFL